MNQRRRNILIVSGFALVVGLPVWFFLSSAHQKERLVVSRIALPSIGLLYIAEQQGFFEQQGLEVEFSSYATGREALKDLDSGRSDLATAYQTPILESALESRPIRVLTSLHTSSRGTGIVARRDRGISHPSDLAGRRIGVPMKTTGELFFRGFVRLEGLSWDAVRVIDVPPSQAETRFLSGELDGMVVWEPKLHRIQTKMAAGKVSTFYSDVYTESSLLVVKDETLINRSGAVRKFLVGLFLAESYLREHPEEAFSCVANAADFRGQDVEALHAAWDVYKLELKLDNLIALTLAKELELRKAAKPGSTYHVEIADLIRSEPLEEVSPEAVTIFRPQGRVRSP